MVDALDDPSLPAVDLVVDAAYGTGFHGTYDAPDPGSAAVLSVDIPSGVDGLTGESTGHCVEADVTVTFAALKPGLLFGDGPRCAGEIELVDIGLDVSGATTHLVEATDLPGWVPRRARSDHK